MTAADPPHPPTDYGPHRRRGLRIWHFAALVLVAAGLLAAYRASGVGPREVVFWTVAIIVGIPIVWGSDYLAPRLRDRLEANDWYVLAMFVWLGLHFVAQVAGPIAVAIVAIYLSSLIG